MARRVTVVLFNNILHDQAAARFVRGASRPARDPARRVVSHLLLLGRRHGETLYGAFVVKDLSQGLIFFHRQFLCLI
jgi:hypothetical protein